MSIKGTSQTLYVGKQESNIITFWGNKKKILYNDLKRIDYFYPAKMEIGYLEFVRHDNETIRFEFNKTANEKISRTIDLIKDNKPDLDFCEHEINELKFYQRSLFSAVITFILGFPLGLIGIFLAWHYKKGTKPWRIFLTAFAVLFWGIWGYISYLDYKSAAINANEIVEDYKKALNNSYLMTNTNTQDVNIKSDSVENTEVNESQEDAVFSVGDVYESDDVKIMYMSCGDYTVENEYSQPETGNKYIFVEFSITNNGDSDYDAGYAKFTCYADDTECSQPLISGEGEMKIITSLSPGKNMKGKIFYEVPIDAQNVEIEYETDVLTGEKIYFDFE